jgi:hypothetical protein
VPAHQLDPTLVISTSPGDEPDEALRWLLRDLIQKAREALKIKYWH